MVLDRARGADSFEPLWERIERNRRRFWVMAVAYVSATTAFFVAIVYLTAVGIPFLWVTLLVGGRATSEAAYEGPERLLDFLMSGEGIAWVVGVTLTAALLYFLYALTRSEALTLGRLGAERAPRGRFLETRKALHDMSLAAGFEHPPPLYVLDSDVVNAFVVGRGPETGAVGVTRGFSVKLDLEETRAVFANLLTRLSARDTWWATVSTGLMHPLWIWKKSYYDVVPFQETPVRVYTTRKQVAAGDRVIYVPDRVTVGSEGMRGDSCLLFPPYAIAVVLAHYMIAGQRRSQLLSAEFADAEGMLLLKDPRAMLAALEKVVREENRIPECGGQYTQFFYAWTGEMSSNDPDDPEYRRLIRLRQTLGAATDEPRTLDDEVLRDLLPPKAPRLEG